MAIDDKLVATSGSLQVVSPAVRFMYPWTTSTDGELWNLGRARRIRVKQGNGEYMIVAEYPDIDHVTLFRHEDEARVQEEFDKIKALMIQMQVPMLVFHEQEGLK